MTIAHTDITATAGGSRPLLSALPTPADESRIIDESGHHLRERETSTHEFTNGRMWGEAGLRFPDLNPEQAVLVRLTRV